MSSFPSHFRLNQPMEIMFVRSLSGSHDKSTNSMLLHLVMLRNLNPISRKDGVEK